MAIVKKEEFYPPKEMKTLETVTVFKAGDDKILSQPMTQDSKQRLIQRQGAIQHAVTSQAVFAHSNSHDEWWKMCEETADKMIAYINKD